MFYEGLQPDDSIMPPIRTSASLPKVESADKGHAIGMHGELVQAPEETLAVHGQRWGLYDADAPVLLHKLHEVQNAYPGHDAVRIQHNHILI